jgi:hypothetical protein
MEVVPLRSSDPKRYASPADVVVPLTLVNRQRGVTFEVERLWKQHLLSRCVGTSWDNMSSEMMFPRDVASSMVVVSAAPVHSQDIVPFRNSKLQVDISVTVVVASSGLLYDKRNIAVERQGSSR